MATRSQLTRTRAAARPPSTLLATFALMITACAPAATGIGTADGRPAEVSKPSRVILATYAELTSFSSRIGGGLGGGGVSGLVMNSPLTVLDPQGTPQPRLAAELPSQEHDTWTVNSDGTMVTTWKIRPNAVWHDGQPVTSKDFQFAFQVYLDPDIVAFGEVERALDRVEVLDDRTFNMHWRRLYPRAVQINSEALPEHLVGDLYRTGDKRAFENSPFWTSPEQYISNGPYRPVQWIHGSQIIFRAFDAYFLGRPKIDELVYQITPDANTVVAYLLAAAVDVSPGLTLNQAGWAVVKPEWDKTGAGQIFTIPKHLRTTQFQMDPNRATEPALLGVHVRRAMLHALDREAIAEAVSFGASPAADFHMSPADPLYPRAQQVAAKYSYDPRRALELFEQAGWTKRGDALVDATGKQLTIDIRTTEMADNVKEMAIMADYFRQIGLAITQTPVPPAARDAGVAAAEANAKFGALTITGHNIDLPSTLVQYYSMTQCTTEERRFSGGNRGCWNNLEFQRLATTATTTLNPAERANAIVEALRVITTEVPVIPMSYNLDNVAVPRGLVGLGPRVGTASDLWNVHDWYWQ